MGLKTSDNTPDGSPRVGLRDRSVRSPLKQTLLKTFKAFVIITLSMFAFLSLYFGAYYRQTENTYRLDVIVVDLDSAASTLSTSSLSPSLTTGAYTAYLGPRVVSAAESIMATHRPVNSTTWALSYWYPDQQTLDSFSLPIRGNDGTITNTPGVDPTQWAERKVLSQDVWGVILVHGNATMLALNAVSGGPGNGGGYDPMGSIGIFYEEARNFQTSNQYVAHQMIEVVTSATQEANTALTLNTLNQAAAGVGGGAAYLADAARRSLMMPFGYSEYNLRPFDQLAGEAATTAGAIYLIIFVFFFTPLWTSTYATIRTKLTLGTDIFLTIFANLGYYFWISLHYSLLTLAFNTDFTRARGKGGFPFYWLVNFVTMTALGFPMQIMFELLGQPYFPFFLVFWVIINVSTVFLDLADMDHFYSYGFVTPVWNNVDSAKHLIFNTKSHLVQNFAVNLAWAIITGLLLVLLVFYRRTKETKKAWADHQKEVNPPKRGVRIFLK